MVSPTRRIIEAKLGPVLEDEDAIFRVAMTAHELLENAAKYASDGRRGWSSTSPPAAKTPSSGCR